MHELSIATSILKSAEREVENCGGGAIKEITLSIGKLAGVEIDSLKFIWSECMRNTVLGNAQIVIFEPEGNARCLDCGTVFGMKKIYDSCPGCGSYFKEILSGKELKINKLIIE
ncbi:MAG: hydrogenase maturation nickel metallochaperone HypA [Dysgonamonadaceae bacterium]|jgi:hydrogenase nickel incorporation protein HypA/HybF|nr:hydrogenase maturation nickel metallochaperone HypA [Dysgonamonadaceae bacterium]